MKIKKNNKKGFTIVELVIVIAVIGILAAILIPTFISLNNKARMANIESFLKNINTQIAMKEADESLDGDKVGSFSTMHSAVEYAKNKGFDLEEISPFAGNEIVWDEANHRFAFVNDGNAVYSEAGFSMDNAQFMPDTQSDLEAKIRDGNKVYVKAKLSGAGAYLAASGHEVKDSFDAGNNTTITLVNYANSTNGKKVIIRTNGGELTVNAADGHVEHYGVSDLIDVVAVSNNSYIEHGTVSQLIIQENAKNVVVTTEAIVVELNKKTEGTTVSVEGYVGALAPESKDVSSGEVGGNIINVYSADQLQGLALSSTLGIGSGVINGKTIILQNDIDLTGRTWIPFGYSAESPFYGTIDGQGYSVIGLSNGDYVNEESYITSSETHISAYGFIALAKDNVTVKNLTLNVNIDTNDGGIGAVIAMHDVTKFTPNVGEEPAEYTCLIENVTVTGTIKAGDKSGGFMSGMYSGIGTAIAQNGNKFVQNIIFRNCTNKASVTGADGSRVAGFIGASNTGGPLGEFNLSSYGGSGKMYLTASIEFDNCKNEGNISFAGKKVGGFICQASKQGGQAGTYITFKNNCANTGTLTGSTTGNLIATNNGSDKNVSVNGTTQVVANGGSLN